VIESLELIGRFADAGNITYYPLGEVIPMHRGLRGDWEDVLYREDTRGRRRVVRMVYEVASLHALGDPLRCKEIWVVGADRWRNPDDDLPADYAQRRVEHYRTLRKPLDPAQFVDELRQEMSSELSALNDALPKLEWLSIVERRSGAIKLTALDAQPEPRNLRRVKDEVLQRWGTVPLVDRLKETVLRTGCLDASRRLRRAAASAPTSSPSGCCWRSTPTGRTPASARSRPEHTATPRTRFATPAGATSPSKWPDMTARLNLAQPATIALAVAG
jgi:hypothetical protein